MTQTSAWRPIATAPRDRILLLYRPHAMSWARIDLAKWNPDYLAARPKPFWQSLLLGVNPRYQRTWTPTHWQPLPEYPNE